MRIITERKLRDFWRGTDGADSSTREKAMREWISIVRTAEWNSFADLRKTFNHADIYCNCTIFDVGGNKYRVVAKVAYGIKVVFIRFVLTHSEYDKKRWQVDCR